jgi:hypothetical protein
MRRESYFCSICVHWYEIEVLSRGEAEEAMRKGYPVGPPTCPKGHVMHKVA